MRRNWTAFNYFQRGLTLVYAGQEVDDPHVPSLFDKDPVHWQTGRDQSDFLTRLAAIKRDPIFAEGSYTLTALPHDVLLAVYEQNGRRVAGLFSLRGASARPAADPGALIRISRNKPENSTSKSISMNQ